MSKKTKCDVLMDGSENPQAGLSLPPDFPYPWCSDYGEDEYGIFMAFTYKGVRQGFRWIPPGTFWMGSPDGEKGRYGSRESDWRETLHQVTLTKGYWLAETTCTQALWQAVMRKNPSAFDGVDRPVDSVSWVDSQKFIKALNTWQPELGLRLPSEAEWERACRSGTQTAYWFGDQMDAERVHFGKSLNVGTLPGMALRPSPWGLYQMLGNVWEWCQDWAAAYPSQAVCDPQGLSWGQLRVLRGGSWDYNDEICRSANRNGLTPEFAFHNVGFRLARDP